ncbi:hypothetical protein EDD15DRAFT_2531626 [Pisolithus albus]|nr:hypothetical protein EDD15DRAFT_2531626 [Pisolithus albus]
MAAMAANRRFVPRQWLLEEVIKKVEHDPATGKRVLGRAWEREEERNDGTALSETGGCLGFSEVVPAIWFPCYPCSQITSQL